MLNINWNRAHDQNKSIWTSSGCVHSKHVWNGFSRSSLNLKDFLSSLNFNLLQLCPQVFLTDMKARECKLHTQVHQLKNNSCLLYIECTFCDSGCHFSQLWYHSTHPNNCWDLGTQWHRYDKVWQGKKHEQLDDQAGCNQTRLSRLPKPLYL